nr:expressed conserved protein [Hymenolepis microstoma]
MSDAEKLVEAGLKYSDEPLILRPKVGGDILGSREAGRTCWPRSFILRLMLICVLLATIAGFILIIFTLHHSGAWPWNHFYRRHASAAGSCRVFTPFPEVGMEERYLYEPNAITITHGPVAGFPPVATFHLLKEAMSVMRTHGICYVYPLDPEVAEAVPLDESVVERIKSTEATVFPSISCPNECTWGGSRVDPLRQVCRCPPKDSPPSIQLFPFVEPKEAEPEAKVDNGGVYPPLSSPSNDNQFQVNDNQEAAVFPDTNKPANLDAETSEKDKFDMADVSDEDEEEEEEEEIDNDQDDIDDDFDIVSRRQRSIDTMHLMEGPIKRSEPSMTQIKSPFGTRVFMISPNSNDNVRIEHPAAAANCSNVPIFRLIEMVLSQAGAQPDVKETLMTPRSGFKIKMFHLAAFKSMSYWTPLSQIVRSMDSPRCKFSSVEVFALHVFTPLNKANNCCVFFSSIFIASIHAQPLYAFFTT